MIPTPQKPELFRGMCEAFREAQRPEDLPPIMMLYALDLDYPRPDIFLAERVVRAEKGWPEK